MFTSTRHRQASQVLRIVQTQLAEPAQKRRQMGSLTKLLGYSLQDDEGQGDGEQ